MKGEILDWCTSDLPPLNHETLSAMLDSMRKWHEGRQFILLPGSDAAILWEYAERHGLGGILGFLAWQGSDLTPAVSSKALKRLYSNQIHFERARMVLGQIADAARNLNIGIAVLKGPALSFQAFGDPGVRAFSDIDLFTHSRDEAIALLKAIDAKPFQGKDSKIEFLSRVQSSENLKAWHRGFELEIRYPDYPPSEPMFAFLGRWKDRLMTVPEGPSSLLDPDPTLHFVFLILHMTVHHMFSRFVWFLDLAALRIRQSARIDWDEIRDELSRLGLSKAGAVVSDFVRRYLDPDFPIIFDERPTWNHPVLERLVNPEAIATGRFGLFHREMEKYLLALFISFLGFHIVSDPGKYPGKHWGYGTEWCLHRFRLAFGVAQPIALLDAILALPITLVAEIPAKAVALFVRLSRSRSLACEHDFGC